MVVIKKAIVCYFDILGFRSLVKNKSRKKRIEISKKLDYSIQKALTVFGIDKQNEKSKDADWKIRVFSDCICLAKPLSDIGIGICLSAISEFIQILMTDNILIRGGVEIGEYIESEFILFSQAQVNAYELESEKAIYPRVIISKNIIEYIKKINDDGLRLMIKAYVIEDDLECFFINYLEFDEEDGIISGHSFFYEQKKKIENILASTKIEDIKKKYMWLATVHNWAIRQAAKTIKLAGIDEDNIWSFNLLLIKNVDIEFGFHCLIEDDNSFNEYYNIKDKIKYYESYFGNINNIDWIKKWPHASSEDDEEEPDREDDINLF